MVTTCQICGREIKTVASRYPGPHLKHARSDLARMNKRLVDWKPPMTGEAA